MLVDFSTASWEQIADTPPSVLLGSLRSIVQSRNPVCLVHPHGFWVTLLHQTEFEDWRMHFWPKGPRPLSGMPAFIHTHDRHVDSRILQGELTNLTYAVESTPEGGSPLYEVGYGGDRYQAKTSNFLSRTETRVQAVLQLSATMRTGDNYRVQRHTYHEAVVPIDVSTATLVRMHGRSPGKVMVVGLDGYPDVIDFTRVERRATEFIADLD